MTPNKPYLLRAFYEWIIDNQLTPYILVNAMIEGVDVPRQYVEDGKIILNISTTAVQDIQISNYWMRFDARFSGQPVTVCLPVHAVLAIYARENGRGMVFNQEEEEGGDTDVGNIPPPPPPKHATKASGKPKLKIVK